MGRFVSDYVVPRFCCRHGCLANLLGTIEMARQALVSVRHVVQASECVMI